MTTGCDQYHLHVYFSDATEVHAREVRSMAEAQPLVEEVGRFHSGPIGPHPVRQFQLLVRTQDVEAVVDWLETVRGPLDVLIHPEIDDDLLAHTALARWLGQAHELDLSRFRD